MGLVTRARSANSNREVAVQLSAKGGALVGGLIPMARQYEDDAVAGLTREDLLVVKRCLGRIYANMKERPATERRQRSRRAAV
jgi:DNA-binding MarR family transcriptional regulator